MTPGRDPAAPPAPAGPEYVSDAAGRMTPEQLRAAYWGRPAPGRVPAVGDEVLYRHSDFGDVETVTVIDVHWSDRADPNVYDERGTLRRDPAPLVAFRSAAARCNVLTREARVPGSAGWLWPEGS